MEESTWIVITEAIKVCFLVGLPIFVAILLASIVVGGIQIMFGFFDHSFSFCVKLLALIITLYFVLPTAQVSFGRLLELAIL